MSGPLRSIVPVAAVLLVIVVAAVAVGLFAGPDEPATYPPDSPEGVVQRYIQSLHDGDIEDAYTLLSSDVQRNTSESEFRDMTRFMRNSESTRRIRLDDVETEDDTATVHLTIEWTTENGLDISRDGYQRRVPLVREDGAWRIDELLTDIASADVDWLIG